ncbi:MAG: VOC family protein [Pirellulales bacterium]
MTNPRLNLVVIRSDEPARTVGFYELLGLRFQSEQHGKGPMHWAAECRGVVFEIYSVKSPDEVNRTTRLGFEVDDVKSVIESLRQQGFEITNDMKQTQWGLRAVVKDPDGRSVELTRK